jgi:O-antigen/teichoic acid export membrane protein
MTQAPARPQKSQGGSSYSAGMAFGLANFAMIGILTLLTSVLSARLYGIKVIGQAALVLAPVTIVTLLSTVREQPAMVRELATLEFRHPRATGIAFAVFAFSFTLTTAVTGIGIVVCYFIFHGPLHNPGLFRPAAAGLCGYLFIINTCWNIDGVFGAFRAGRELFAARLHQAAMYGVLLVGFVFISNSVWGILWAFLGSWFTSLLHRTVLLRRVIRLRVSMTHIRAGFSTLRTIITFGLKMTPGFLATGVSEASGTWILGATSSISVVGAYSRAWSFATKLTELNWRITEMLLPTLVQHRHAGNSKAFNRVLTESLRYAAFGMLLPAAVGGGASAGIMRLFGNGFGIAAAALQLLFFVPLLQTLVAIQGTALMAHNRPLLTAVAQTVRLAVTLVAGIILTQADGVTGMAIAMATGSFVCFGVCFALLRFRLGMSMPALLRFRQLAGFAAAYCSGFAIAHILDQKLHSGLGLVAALTCGTITYVAVGIGVSGTTDQDRARLKSLKERITSRRPVELSSTA